MVRLTNRPDMTLDVYHGRKTTIQQPHLLQTKALAVLKVHGYTFRGSNSVIFIVASHLIRGQLLKKRICFFRSRFFPFKVDLILKGLQCLGKQTGSHKSCFPL